MSTDYTPTTEQVRSHYVFDQGDVWRRERGEAFDRWLAETLAAHDREVAAKALEDAAEDFRVNTWADIFRGVGTKSIGAAHRMGEWLRARAAALRTEGKEDQ